MSMHNSFKTERDKFTAKDDEAMCFMLYRLLNKNNDDATLPCGLKIWRAIRSMGYLINHTDHSLASHMRRHIFPRFDSIGPNLPPAIENYLKRAYRRYIFPMHEGNFRCKKSATLSNASSVEDNEEEFSKNEDDGEEQESKTSADQPPSPKVSSSNSRKVRSKRKQRLKISDDSNLSAVDRNSMKKSRNSSEIVKSTKISTPDESGDSNEERSSPKISESGSDDSALVDILLTANQTEHDVSSGFEISDVAHKSVIVEYPSVACRIENMINTLSNYEANTTAVSALDSSSSTEFNSPPKIVENIDANCNADVEAGPSNGSLKKYKPTISMAFTTSTPKDPCVLPNLGAEFVLPKSTVDENRPSNENTQEILGRIYGLTPEEIEKLLLTNQDLLTNTEDVMCVMEKLIKIEQLSLAYDMKKEEVVKVVKKFKRLDNVEKELKKRAAK